MELHCNHQQLFPSGMTVAGLNFDPVSCVLVLYRHPGVRVDAYSGNIGWKGMWILSVCCILSPQSTINCTEIKSELAYISKIKNKKPQTLVYISFFSPVVLLWYPAWQALVIFFSFFMYSCYWACQGNTSPLLNVRILKNNLSLHP